MYRAVKNKSGVIILIAKDEGQEGNYPEGSSAKERQGVWCKWTMEEIPALERLEDAPRHALRFKENKDKDGVALRSVKEMSKSPHG